jgi:DnaJ-class molecular chaperone
MSTHYESLHVTEDAPDEVIRASYRALSLKHHPDQAGERPQSKWKMQRINDAYAVLSDIQKRADYDLSLRQQRNPRPQTARPASNRAHAHTQPKRRYTHVSSRPPSRFRSRLGWLTDARLALPLAAVLWLIIYWIIAQR